MSKLKKVTLELDSCFYVARAVDGYALVSCPWMVVTNKWITSKKNPPWRVFHGPTGLAYPYTECKTRKAAVALAEKINDLDHDWASVVEQMSPTEALATQYSKLTGGTDEDE